jgi:hypothetical protein
MLGCLFGSGLLPYRAAEFLAGPMKTVPAQVAETNDRAFRAGERFAADQTSIIHESPPAEAQQGIHE